MKVFFKSTNVFIGLCLFLFSQDARERTKSYTENYCLECHDGPNGKGNLDLNKISGPLTDLKVYSSWVKIFDRVSVNEMPPKKEARPPAPETKKFLADVASALTDYDLNKEKTLGRSTWRRMNRFEYENTLRDLLSAPWLQIRDILPEDGEAFLYNKVGGALDISHVQMQQYLAAADYALREVLTSRPTLPESKVNKYYAREQGSFTNKIKFSEFNKSPERATFPILGTSGQPKIRSGEEEVTVGSNNPEVRELEAMGVVASSYEPIEPKFDRFTCRISGRYKVRINAYSVWVGPGPTKSWWTPDLNKVSEGKRSEPVYVFSERNP